MNSLSVCEKLAHEGKLGEFVESLTPDEQVRLMYEWSFWARPSQIDPGTGNIWLLLAGRGFGKNRSGAEWVRHRVESGVSGRLGFIARTAADARDVMVEGESGIMAVSPNWFRPKYEPSKRRLTWPNGARATTYTAEEPSALRGPEHDTLWMDEPAHWLYPQEAFDNAMLGLRIGSDPRVCATTTPLPIPLIKDLVSREGNDVAITRGTTFDNLANLAEVFINQITQKFAGTRLGRQELEGILLEDVEGALWTSEVLEGVRTNILPDMRRIIVGVDPSGGAGEQGIVVCGLGYDGLGYVLADYSCCLSPRGWARRVAKAYYDWEADLIVGERNYGGDMVKSNIQSVDARLPVEMVTATRGKAIRAEPIANMYGDPQNLEDQIIRVRHYVGQTTEEYDLRKLEGQMTGWTPYDNWSPDRLDACVWALTELMLGGDVVGKGSIRKPKRSVPA